MHDTAKEVGVIRREIEFIKKHFDNGYWKPEHYEAFRLFDRLDRIDEAAKAINNVVDTYYTKEKGASRKD